MTIDARSPVHPAAFGEELKRLRASSGLALEDITAETKISRRVLEALEAGKFQFLPDRVFSRNFVRQYARAVGCGDDHLVEGFDAAWERFQLTSGSHAAFVVDEPPPSRPIRWHFWLPLAVAAAIVTVVAAVILADHGPQTTLLPDPRRPIRVQTMPPLAPTTDQIVPAVDIPPAVPEEAADPVTLTVHVHDGKECWIQYRDGEGMTGQRLLAGGDVVRLDLIGPVKFTVGNAAAVTIVVGNTQYDDLGRPGQVVHTEVSQKGLVPLGAGARYD